MYCTGVLDQVRDVVREYAGNLGGDEEERRAGQDHLTQLVDKF